MVTGTKQYDDFQIGKLREHLFVTVPWDKAADLQTRLQNRGIASTACLDPVERTAGLEIHQDVDPETLRAILSAPRG